jgi:hypothetical protein
MMALPDSRNNNIMTGDNPLIVGWREWVSLPELGIRFIKAKIDTGARSSALHTFSLERFTRGGETWLRYGVHPKQQATRPERFAEARMIDERWVTDSGGHRERRPVILTPLAVGGLSWPIEVTLTDRDTMRFRLLIGRTAMQHGLIVNPGASYLTGRRKQDTRTR